MLIGSDLDGTYRDGLDPPPQLVISGRTFAEYDDRAKAIAALMPVYIRGTGAYGDRQHAGQFKQRDGGMSADD